MLILVRHGETAANAAGLLLGRADPGLTELGRRQATALAVALGACARVVSSPLARARDTAAALGLPVEIDQRWVELDYGEYDGRPALEMPEEVWRRWRSDPGFSPSGGESLATLERRVRSACEELAPAADQGDVVVVTHVSPIKAAVAWALGVGVETAFRMHLDVAAICRIEVGGAGPVLWSFNECSHLEGVGTST